MPFPPPGDLPDPVIEHASPALAGGFVTTELPWKPFLLIVSGYEERELSGVLLLIRASILD